MQCKDMRGALSLFVEGQLALTEWAIIQAHLQECAECRAQVEGARIRSAELARARRRLLTLGAAGATGVLIVAVAGLVAVYRSAPLPWPSRDLLRLLPSATTRPADPPAPVAAPVPPAVATPPPVPAPVRPQPAVEPPPRVVAPAVTPPAVASPPVVPPAEPLRRVTRSPATSEPAAEERMPTQMRPAAPVTAPPDAEAMPTQRR
jgi:hypothetical protein